MIWLQMLPFVAIAVVIGYLANLSWPIVGGWKAIIPQNWQHTRVFIPRRPR